MDMCVNMYMAMNIDLLVVMSSEGKDMYRPIDMPSRVEVKVM